MTQQPAAVLKTGNKLPTVSVRLLVGAEVLRVLGVDWRRLTLTLRLCTREQVRALRQQGAPSKNV